MPNGILISSKHRRTLVTLIQGGDFRPFVKPFSYIGEANSKVNPPNRLSILIPLAALTFAAVHLVFEHLTGGVQSHHLLNRPDLPAVSNWFGLITLPLLGVATGLRAGSQRGAARWAGIPSDLLAAFLGALLYGVVLAISFEAGASSIGSIAFFGLFLCALVFPVYRAEYMLGLVAGMTFTFGAALPFLIASVLAAISFVIRGLIRAVAAVVRKWQPA